MSYKDQVQHGGPAQAPAGIRALQEARRKVLEHIASTSKELGGIAAQYGKLIGNYQAELEQISASLAVLQPAVRGYNDCDAQQVQAPGY